MLLRHSVLERIVRGEVDLAFRRWKRPTVKAGGTLTTRVGVLAIDAVEATSIQAITEQDARRAGHASKAELLEVLAERPDGHLVRVALRFVGDDPRVALRARASFTAEEQRELEVQLTRLDARAADGPWTRRVLELIERHPATLAEKLGQELGLEKARFKPRVRRLKALGLTESLDVGYRLSPRGAAFLRHLQRGPKPRKKP